MRRHHSEYNNGSDRWDDTSRPEQNQSQNQGGLRRVPLSSYFKDPQSRWVDDNEPHRGNEYRGAPGADRDWEGDQDIPGSRNYPGNRNYTYNDRDRREQHDNRYENPSGRADNRSNPYDERYSPQQESNYSYSRWHNDRPVSRNQGWRHHDSDLGSRNQQRSHERWPEDPYIRNIAPSQQRNWPQGYNQQHERAHENYWQREQEHQSQRDREARERNHEDINYWRREQDSRR